MSIDFTVAIPVYNGADRVTKVIEQLRAQVGTENLSWEILVIDNNSNDGLDHVIHNLQKSWNHSFALHYIKEPKQGLTFARVRAIESAQGKYIGFLDDDNLAYPNWVISAYRFGERYPKAGAYGGQIQADFEVEPPDSIRAVKNFLVIRSLGDRPQRFNPERLQLPAGAGLVVRKQAWRDSIPAQMVRITRGGNDYQISLYMHKHHWEIWYCPTMIIKHHIPKWRMEPQYVASLAHLYGLCTCELQMIIVPLWKRPFFLLKSFLGAIKRLIIHLFQHGSQLQTDVSARCNLAFHWGNVKSPWFYIRNASNRLWLRTRLALLTEYRH